MGESKKEGGGRTKNAKINNWGEYYLELESSVCSFFHSKYQLFFNFTA